MVFPARSVPVQYSHDACFPDAGVVRLCGDIHHVPNNCLYTTAQQRLVHAWTQLVAVASVREPKKIRAPRSPRLGRQGSIVSRERSTDNGSANEVGKRATSGASAGASTAPTQKWMPCYGLDGPISPHLLVFVANALMEMTLHLDGDGVVVAAASREHSTGSGGEVGFNSDLLGRVVGQCVRLNDACEWTRFLLKWLMRFDKTRNIYAGSHG